MIYGKKIYAVIPVKSTSERLNKKNFRDFYNGKSLLEIKIKQCLDAGIFADIFVSSDSNEAEIIAHSLGATFVHRDVSLCNNVTPWSQVIVGILNSLPIMDDEYVLWCHVTSPLFDGQKDLVYNLLAHPENDSVVTVTQYKYFMLDADFVPINYMWGPWHSYSQNLKPVYQMNLAGFLALKGTMVRNQYIIGDRPHFQQISMFDGTDIDTMEEFELASLLYERKFGSFINETDS
jgi:CMP-N-acetylneuraminic acid synthetase